MGWIVSAVMLGATKLSAQQPRPTESKKKAESEVEEVSPAEDLMREHGVLNRILLIYDEAIRRLKVAEDLDPAVLASAAGIIRSFIEDYHEKLEEDYLFPRFEKAGKLTDLVRVLLAQHRAGRRLTDQIQQLSTAKTLKDRTSRNQLTETLRLFVRMYRPHEAREDTVLFPALRSIVTPKEYDALGEEFEDKEHQLFGEHGFEKIVDDVARLEKTLGIYDLSRFTPAS
jgi:hemerythrin-like domain-containing protein